MGTHRSIPELMKLCVYDCHELEQIVAESEELVQLPNAELYFPKLKEITVFNCNKLKSLFPISMVTMLPQLSTLQLYKNTQLQEVFRDSREDDIMNQKEIVLSNLEEISLVELPNFLDICHGCKLHAVKLLRFFIYECPRTSRSLRQIQVTFLPS
ncbi:disease resistance protein [Trifolium repens]|nr:disease resistance protein [Trifolium repens]